MKSIKRKILLFFFLNIILNTISQHQQTLLRREKIWSRQIYDVTCTFYLSLARFVLAGHITHGTEPEKKR